MEQLRSSPQKTKTSGSQTAETDDVIGASEIFAPASPLSYDDLGAYASLPANDHVALAYWATTFFPYQREWLFDPSTFGIACKARQIGFSHTSAAVAVVWSAFHGEMTTIISVGKREAKEVLAKCAAHARILQALGSKMAEMISVSKEEIVFASGGRILALPSEGGRSFSGNVILDEFAYQKHAEAVWDAAAPVMTLGDFRLRVISTPNGNGNSFAVSWEDAIRPDSGWSVHRVAISTAIAQGFPADMKKAWLTSKGDPRLFEQFYNCSFLDAVLQYFSSGRIDSCRTREILLPTDDGDYYAGLDVGRNVDLTVLTIVLVKFGVARLVHVEEMARTDGEGMDRMIDSAFMRYKLRRLCIDSSGMGYFPAERMRNKYGDRIDVPHRRNRVELVDFTLKSKERLVTNGYSMMTSKRLLLPDADRNLPSFERDDVDGDNIIGRVHVNKSGTALEIRKELASILRVVTKSGNVTYDSPRTSKGHGDRAWSLLLALSGIETMNPMTSALLARMGINVVQ